MSISNEQVVAFIKKNPIGVGCGILSIALAATIYYRSDLVPAAQTELDEKATLSDRLAANLKFGKDIPEQVQQLADYNKAIDSRMVNGKDILSNQQYFYNLESITGTKIGTPQMTNAPRAKGSKSIFVPVTFNLNVQGTYPQLLDFLTRLETGLHFFRVLNAHCARASGAGPNGGDMLSLNLTFELLGQP